MDGMKRAAKILRNRGDLGVVVIEQKCMLEVASGKLIPTLGNVSSALLKWSYTEANYTFPNVFSAWCDLDAGFTQLLETYLEECSRYRRVFKDIIVEGKKVTDMQNRKDKSASKLAATKTKLEAVRKQAKKNEKLRVQLDHLEADLVLVQSKDDELAESQRNTTADFELYKASLLKNSLVTHCRALQSLLQKSSDLCQVKLEIAESMPDGAALTPDSVADSNKKVEGIFSKYHLQLPPRDPALERNLPVQQFKTLAPALQSSNPPSKSPSNIGKQRSSVPVITQNNNLKPKKGVSVFPPSDNEDDSDDDDHDYMFPAEGILPKIDQDNKPPQVPPRNSSADYEDQYVIPTLSPHSPKGFYSNREEAAEYFEVESDEDTKPPSNSSKHLHEQHEYHRMSDISISEPVYTIPPEDCDREIDDDGDYNQLYSNMINEELREQQRLSVSLPPASSSPRKTHKPAVYPKPFRKTVKDTPPPNKDSVSQDEQVAGDDFDSIYSCVCEDEEPVKPQPFKSD